MIAKTRPQGLSIFALVMLITVAIDSVRNLPATALFGSTLIFFFIFSAIVFLIPTSLVSAELTARSTTHSGIYYWVKAAFGEKMAFLAIWLQWINTMVWYPTILSFIAGTAAFLISPNLANSKVYLVSVILAVFWLLTLINLKGIHTSARFASFCAVVGMIIPMALIIILAAIWVVLGKPLQIHFTSNDLLPRISDSNSWISLTAIMTAFLGMELAAVHIKHIRDPQRAFPKAMLISAIIILATMVFGSLAIAIVLPQNQINLVAGVMEAFTNFFNAYHISGIIPIITIMLLIGSLGNIINWIISPAKGLLQAAQHGYLPAFLTKENNHGVASRLLLLQAGLVTVICLAFLLMPSINGSYWLLSDLSTQLYMLMYVLMFLAAIIIRHKFPNQRSSFTIPGGKKGMWLVASIGIIGCIITLIVGFFPPSGINVGGVVHYELTFTGGIIAMIVPVPLFYWYKAACNPHTKTTSTTPEYFCGEAS